MKLYKFLLASAMFASTTYSPAFSASTFELKLFNIDDSVKVFLTNTNYNNALITQKGFSQNHPVIDLAPYIASGLNILSLELYNGPAGWSYGYDFQIDAKTYASGSCGFFNTFGCNNDAYGSGLVWSTQIAFNSSMTSGSGGSVSPVPEPAAWALMIGGFGLVGATQRQIKKKSKLL